MGSLKVNEKYIPEDQSAKKVLWYYGKLAFKKGLIFKSASGKNM